MRILVTGTEGYLGHVFAPTLLAAGHDVIGVDTGFYREAQLYRGVDQQARNQDGLALAFDFGFHPGSDRELEVGAGELHTARAQAGLEP